VRSALALAFLASVSAVSPLAAQTATFSVLLDAGPVVEHGTVVNGIIQVAWAADGGIGYAGGSFRLRMEGLDVADVLSPNNSGGGLYLEPGGDRVSVPAERLPPPAGPVTDRWTTLRRPKSAYLLDASDPTSLRAGGGFRFPPNAQPPTDLGYRVEQQAGVTYVTGRNAAFVEIGIEHAQIPLNLQTDPLFFVPEARFDLFKFQVRAPLHGTGAVTITPEPVVAFGNSAASIYTSPDGAQAMLTPDQIQTLGASFSYVPEPGAAALLGIALLFLTSRTRSHT
jgi:hypothetical protein